MPGTKKGQLSSSTCFYFLFFSSLTVYVTGSSFYNFFWFLVVYRNAEVRLLARGPALHIFLRVFSYLHPSPEEGSASPP